MDQRTPRAERGGSQALQEICLHGLRAQARGSHLTMVFGEVPLGLLMAMWDIHQTSGVMGLCTVLHGNITAVIDFMDRIGTQGTWLEI